MPEVSFQLEWPDGKSSTLYSPSTVILDYFRPGDSLLVSELEERGVEALRAASERVRARYGFACTRTDEDFFVCARTSKTIPVSYTHLTLPTTPYV